MTLTALSASSILPANTGVILKGTANTTYSFVKSTGTPATIGTNELKATSETSVQADVQKNYYVLNNGGSSVNQIGFYKATSASVIPANKAYYIGTGANSLLFEGDDLTGIDGVIGKEATETTGKYYQLNGIEEKNPVKGGIYLHNGKKILK